MLANFIDLLHYSSHSIRVEETNETQSRNMIDDIFFFFYVMKGALLNFIFHFFCFKTVLLKKSPDKNLDYLVAEEIDKNVNYRYMFQIPFFFFFNPALAVTKATLIKRKKSKL